MTVNKLKCNICLNEFETYLADRWCRCQAHESVLLPLPIFELNFELDENNGDIVYVLGVKEEDYWYKTGSK